MKKKYIIDVNNMKDVYHTEDIAEASVLHASNFMFLGVIKKKGKANKTEFCFRADGYQQELVEVAKSYVSNEIYVSTKDLITSFKFLYKLT